MSNQTIVKFIALNQSQTVAEEVFTIRDLKIIYPKLWFKSQKDYQIFINLCLDKWLDKYPNIVFNVATFDIIENQKPF